MLTSTKSLVRQTLAVLTITVAAVGCTSAASRAQPVRANTPVSQRQQPLVGDAMRTNLRGSTQGSDQAPVVLNPTTTGSRFSGIEITQDFDGRTVVVPAGAVFLTRLDAQYLWKWDIDNKDAWTWQEAAAIPLGGLIYLYINKTGSHVQLVADAYSQCTDPPKPESCTPITGPHVVITIIAGGSPTTEVVTLGLGQNGVELHAKPGDLIAVDLGDNAGYSIDSVPAGIHFPLQPFAPAPQLATPPRGADYFQVLAPGRVTVDSVTPVPYHAVVVVQ